MGVTEVINRYLYNIEKWEAGVSDLKEWERIFIIGQKHACETLLECFEKDAVPAHWPEVPFIFTKGKDERVSPVHPYRGDNVWVKITEVLGDPKLAKARRHYPNVDRYRCPVCGALICVE